MVEEGCGTGIGRGAGEGNSLGPADGAVSNEQKVCKIMGNGQRANQVDVALGKMTERNGNRLRGDVNVAVNLPMLARQTFLGPEPSLVWPCMATQNENTISNKRHAYLDEKAREICQNSIGGMELAPTDGNQQ
jgi:hypothetical protein